MVVVADTSAGVKNRRLARQTVRMVVQNLPSGCRLRLACADVSCRWLHDGWIAPDGPEARQALRRLENEIFLGTFDLKAAVDEVLKAFPADKSPRRRIMIFVGTPHARPFLGSTSDPSGRPLESPPVQDMAGRLGKAKVAGCVALVEPESDGPTSLTPLTAAYHGAVLHVTNREERKGLLEWLLAGLPDPRRIIRLEVDGASQDDLFYPDAWLPGRRTHRHGADRGHAAPATELYD